MRLTRKRSGSTRSKRKDELARLLQTRDREALLAWAGREPKAVRTLFAALFETDDLQRWRAIEALGWVAGVVARDNEEAVRDWIRRILWNMMEESGGLMWHGPEAIGEMLANAPWLVREYAGPLGSFRVEEPFEAGTYMALARMAAVDPSAVATIAIHIVPGLKDPDPRIRAHAALALGRMNHAPSHEQRSAMTGDSAALTIYDPDRGELHQTTVGALVQSELTG